MEVSHENICTRAGNSVCTMCCGTLLVPLCILLIFWNENDAVVNYATVDMLHKADVMATCEPQQSSNGKLVFGSCRVSAPDLSKSDDLPSQLQPFLKAFPGTQISWKTEIYQYKESSSEVCHKDSTGGKTCTKTYSCDLDWSDSEVDSGGFECSGYHDNTGHGLPVGFGSSGSVNAKKGSVVLSQSGSSTSHGFILDTNLQLQFPSVSMENTIQSYSQGWTQWYGRAGGQLSPRMLQANGKYLTTYYKGAPQLGDLRISFSGRFAEEVTVAAKQLPSSNHIASLGPWPSQTFGWFGKHTKPVEKLYEGELSLDGFVTRWTSEVTAQLWMIRFLGLIIMVIAFEMIVQPLSVAADLLRTIDMCTCGLGSILDNAAQCVLHTAAFVLAVVVTLLTVAVAWLVARPFYAILMLVLAVAVFLCPAYMRKSQARDVGIAGADVGLVGPSSRVAAQQQVVLVTCPPHAGPGQEVTFTSPTGQQFQARVPANIGPGQTFEAQIPL